MPFDIVDCFAITQTQQKDIDELKKEQENIKTTIKNIAGLLESQGLVKIKKKSEEKEMNEMNEMEDTSEINI